jgi:hypothetical protein
MVYVALDEHDEAFRWLETAYEEHDAWFHWLRLAPYFVALHSDPRYEDLVRRLNLPD